MPVIFYRDITINKVFYDFFTVFIVKSITLYIHIHIYIYIYIYIQLVAKRTGHYGFRQIIEF